jgi:hypothetical protein
MVSKKLFEPGYNAVIRTTGIDDTPGRLGDGEAEVAILDVQLVDGTAWASPVCPKCRRRGGAGI